MIEQTLFYAPFSERWVTQTACAAEWQERLVLSRTPRYRLGRLWERMTFKPVRPDSASIVSHIDFVLNL